MENDALKEDNKQLVDSASQDTLTIQALQNSNDELTNELAELSKDLKSTKIELLSRQAKEAQRLADQQKKKRQQIRAIQEASRAAQTGSINPGFYVQAAKNLQNFTTNVNKVTPVVLDHRSTGGNSFDKF